MRFATLSHRNRFSCSRTASSAPGSTSVTASSTVHASRFQLDRLQSILNAAARIILRTPKFSHISASIRSKLHWLPVRFRPEFEICLFVRNCLIGAAPAYLQELCVAVSSSAGRRSLRSASRGDLVVPRTDYYSIWAARFLCFRAGHLKENQKERLRVLEMTFLRQIEGVTRRDRVRNQDIYTRLQYQRNVVQRIQQRRLRYFGHVVRMDPTRYPKVAMEGYVHGQKR